MRWSLRVLLRLAIVIAAVGTSRVTHASPCILWGRLSHFDNSKIDYTTETVTCHYMGEDGTSKQVAAEHDVDYFQCIVDAKALTPAAGMTASPYPTFAIELELAKKDGSTQPVRESCSCVDDGTRLKSIIDGTGDPRPQSQCNLSFGQLTPTPGPGTGNCLLWGYLTENGGIPHSADTVDCAQTGQSTTNRAIGDTDGFYSCPSNFQNGTISLTFRHSGSSLGTKSCSCVGSSTQCNKAFP